MLPTAPACAALPANSISATPRCTPESSRACCQPWRRTRKPQRASNPRAHQRRWTRRPSRARPWAVSGATHGTRKPRRARQRVTHGSGLDSAESRGPRQAWLRHSIARRSGRLPSVSGPAKPSPPRSRPSRPPLPPNAVQTLGHCPAFACAPPSGVSWCLSRTVASRPNPPRASAAAPT